ncbi:MAG: Gfo/Idh/MocA family oxidoreductase [Planctomycetota bacterium]|nr:Gfo/Idh/MocA family oxidoreductase [Planctomycetota bacterium]
MPRLAVIGFGGRVKWMVAEMCKLDPELELAAVADPDEAGVRERLKLDWMPKWANVPIFRTADEVLDKAHEFDAFAIGTRCFMHTPMAVRVAQTGLPLFLEKPVAIDEQQLAQLAQAFRGREDQVVVSFPLRVTPLLTTALDIIRSGRLGTINQVQAFNNVSYGGVYFGEWYRNFDQTGGLWLQKATHDFDYINRILDVRPTMVSAMTTHKIYGGDMPHDLRCSKCDKTETCPESPKALKLRGDGGGMGMEDHWCAFSKEIKNEDAGSALIRYADGAHVSYAQNFISRRSAGARGATVVGYKGTLHFDWYTNLIKVIDHHGNNRVDTIEVKPGSGHGGGDQVLCQMFIDLIRGKARPTSTLRDGLLSASMCLAARRSSQNNTFEVIPPVTELASLTPQLASK